jgi:hypothetical protein
MGPGRRPRPVLGGTWPELRAILPPQPTLGVDIGRGEGRLGRELLGLGCRVLGWERSGTLAGREFGTKSIPWLLTTRLQKR